MLRGRGLRGLRGLRGRGLLWPRAAVAVSRSPRIQALSPGNQYILSAGKKQTADKGVPEIYSGTQLMDYP